MLIKHLLSVKDSVTELTFDLSVSPSSLYVHLHVRAQYMTEHTGSIDVVKVE